MEALQMTKGACLYFHGHNPTVDRCQIIDLGG